MVGAKRRKVSKNKKTNWRKHSNVKDVEEYLDGVRLQERTGGLLAEKSNAELFVIDKNVSTDQESATVRRARKKLPKQLKCHALLLPDSDIKPARVKHNVKKVKAVGVKSKVEAEPMETSEPVKSSTKTKTSKSKTGSSGGIKQRILKSATGLTKTRAGKFKRITTHDLWNDDSQLQDKSSLAVDAIDEGHFSIVTKRRRVKAPKKFLEKPFVKAAVEVPHPGASYNPLFEDHQDLLQDAIAVEVEKDRAAQRIIRSLDEKFPSKADAPTEATYLKEMSAGLKGVESDSEGADESDGDEDDDKMPVVQPLRGEKKTQTQRNKERRQREMQAQKQKQKEENIKKNEFYRLKSIKKEVAAGEATSFQRQYKRAVRQRNKVEGTRKLGFRGFEAPDLELKLSDEMEGSLRLLKPEGSLFDDRFKSLQKRNVIEPRVRARNVRKRKYKKKTFENKSHKDITL